MNYKKMIENARNKGVATETAMWHSVDSVNEMLDKIKEEHPKEYWRFMRNTHENLFGRHYNEEFARWDINELAWKDKNGIKHSGEHWTKEEVLAATSALSFPPGTTDCDKWVAFNSFYADTCNVLTEGEVIASAHAFFFEDMDFPSEGKVWCYMKITK